MLGRHLYHIWIVCIYVGVPCVQCLLVLEECVRSPKTGAVLWFLVVTLMKIYNDTEQAEQ